MVLALAQCGGDSAASVLNAKDEEGWAPIHSAASSGNSQIVDILLERGTRPSPIRVGGELYYFCYGFLRLVGAKLVVHDGIDVLLFSDNIVSTFSF